MDAAAEKTILAYLEFYRDLGVYDFYRRGEPARSTQQAETADVSQSQIDPEGVPSPVASLGHLASLGPVALPGPMASPGSTASEVLSQTPLVTHPAIAPATATNPELEPMMAAPIGFNELLPLPGVRIPAAGKAAALQSIHDDIGDCTRCPLAYAGRHTIVFGDGDPGATLMFVGEGPGADEDASGVPFVGKAGQLLNNMIAAMGLKREQVYIANIVKCRPPGNRVPEPAEANTCTQFLVRQMDVVRPQYVVALGSTAAMYLLGVKKPLSELRGRWHDVRDAQCVVTYHPAYLLRDPRQKGEAWKDLQLVMSAMGLKGAAKT